MITLLGTDIGQRLLLPCSAVEVSLLTSSSTKVARVFRTSEASGVTGATSRVLALVNDRQQTLALRSSMPLFGSSQVVNATVPQIAHLLGSTHIALLGEYITFRCLDCLLTEILSDALQPAPEAGTWFQTYFQALVTNAQPSL
jgi:hypothetical protein